ncbi:hypothetical protein E3P77_01003 [Wallemia ichthyophaga]|nr:hypothetical protein E3P84_02224 [Wallemia ichthyophaga]TIB41266.1 hypothetical protein E3P83_02177 [Wallemia ichthyophaga]TIB68535.1 hypothetical protein E3P77_01003 [Wallemia ichthyophaga]
MFSRGILKSCRGLAAQQSRKYASSIPQPATQVTTLPNGLTIATEQNDTKSATVGVWIDSGSRGESIKNNGTAHFLEHMAFKGTNRRSQYDLELEVESLGAHLNAYTSREQTVYYAKSFSHDVPKAVDVLSDILQNSKLDSKAIERERDVILREEEEVNKQVEEVVFDHLHAVAFQGEPLGQTILGPSQNIKSLTRDQLSDYIKNNYHGDKMVLAGAGGVSHSQLVELANQHFGNLSSSPNPLPLGTRPSAEHTKFTGSEVRIRDDSSPTCNLAIAVEGVSWSSPDYFPMLVMQSIFGNWDRSLGASPLLSSKLSHIISENNLANSYMSFSTSYSDTGLWGIYLVSENLMNLDDLVHFTLKEWQRMSIAPTVAEVERAKSQLKASLLLGLDGSTAVTEDIGRQIVTTGKRMTPTEIENAIAAVTPEEIIRVANKYLWDKDIAIAAHGRTEGLLDYNRIRADMSSIDSAKDVAAKLAQLDEKLHVEEKIKDGAENLLQVFDTAQSDHQEMLRRQVEEALTKANNNINKFTKDIEYLKLIPNTPRKETHIDSARRRRVQDTFIDHHIDDYRTAHNNGLSLLNSLLNINDSAVQFDPDSLMSRRIDVMAGLTDALKRSFRLKYELDQSVLINGVKECLSDSAGGLVRTVAYRLLRHSLVDYSSAQLYNSYGINIYLIRSLARDSSDQLEKEQAVFFIRALVDLGNPHGLFIDQSIVRAIISIAENGDDSLRYFCLELLAEIAILDMELLSKSQGLNILLSALTGSSPDLAHFAPVVASIFCYTLDHPSTRKYIKPGTDLEVSMTAFTDVPSAHFKASNARIERLKCANSILVVLLKNWSGLLYFCVNDRNTVRTLIDALRVPSQELREALLDLMFELLIIKTPDWYVASLEGRRQTMYNRSTGQRKAPERSAQDSDKPEKITIIDHYIALLLVVLIDGGLIEGLTAIVEEKNQVLTRKATLLLGELLRKGNRILPSAYAAKLQTLPRLFALAAEYSGDLRLSACSALATIDHFNRVRNRPIPAATRDSRKRSNSLDDPMRRGQRQVEQVKMRIGMQIDDKNFQAMLLESQVLVTKDNVRWNYDVVYDLLEGPLLNPRRLEEAIKNTKFIKRLMSFFHPFNLRFSNAKKTKPNMKWVRMGCQLVTTFLTSEEGRRYLAEDKLLRQIGDCFSQLDPLHSNQALDGEPIFSRNRLEDTLCIGYFEMIGTISKTPEGIQLLEKHKMFTSFYHLSELRSREDLIKAIIEKLDYSNSGHPRIILSKALTASYKHVRQFATTHLGELILSSPKPNEWALDLLITQLYDPAIDICELAVKYLEKVCESTEILELVVSMMPSLDHLGETGHPLMLRFLSTSVGFKYLQQSDYIDREIDDWFHERNAHYVVLIEVYISHALGMSSFDQSEEAITFDGTVPSHFYGELTKTYEGCEFLAEKGHFADFAEFIRRHGFENSDTDLISKLKSVLWAVGTIGSTPHGLPFLEHERIIGTIVEIAERNEFISVKGTCYFVLGLIASTEAGITILERFGWQSTVSTLGQPLGICLPKNLNKFVHIPEWEAYTNRHVQSAFVLEEPTKPIERQIIGVLSDLSNQLVAGGASRSLAKLKAQDKAPFRAPARKCILDAFDIEFNDSTVRAVMKASQLLKDGGKDVNVDLHATEMAEMKWREELSDIINDEVGVLLKKKYNTAEFNEKNLLAASMDSDQESADVRKVRDIRGDKVEKLEPINTVIGGFGSETSQPARQPRLQE